VHHSKLWRTGKIMQEMAQQPETTHKPLTFANLGRIELGSGLAHPVASDAGINGASWRLRSELEADVTKMMNFESAAASSYLKDSARNDTNHQKNCSRLRWCLREPTMEQ
jgi:hypothetical protein